MTEDKTELKEDEFTITKDDGGDKKKAPSLFGMLAEAEKAMDKINHAITQLGVLGITERIYSEDRDASALFRNKDGRCDVHGVKCTQPCCNVCGFADMQSRRVCAIMDNLGKLYNAREDWKQDDDGDEDGVPEGLCPDIDKL